MQWRLVLCSIWLLTGALSAHAQTLQGLVVRVLDGDTLELLTPNFERVRVRLAWIDAPEKGQAFGNKAREHLADLCAGVVAQARPTAQDRYGRTVAEVDCLGLNANEAMVGSGLAWVYRAYAPARNPVYQPLYDLEAQARSNQTGLWRDPMPQAPWDWRRAQARSR